jgi:hypothetical protein
MCLQPGRATLSALCITIDLSSTVIILPCLCVSVRECVHACMGGMCDVSVCLCITLWFVECLLQAVITQ